MDLQRLMTEAALGGWKGLEPSMADAKKQFAQAQSASADETKRQAAIVARVFGTEDGRALLDLLLRHTVLRPFDDEERAVRTAEAAAILAARRQGQAGVTNWLLWLLQVDAGAKPAPTTGGDVQ